MSFDPLIGEEVVFGTGAVGEQALSYAHQAARALPKSRVESFLLGRGSRGISILEALTILDHERCCEPVQTQGAHVRRRVTKADGAGEKRLNVSDVMAVLDHQRQFGGHVEHILVYLGLTQEEEIVRELTTHYGFPYLPVSLYELDRVVVRVLPIEVARHYCMIPIDRISNILTVAVANPLNTEAIKDVQRLTGCSVLPMVARASEIRKKIEECHGMFFGVSDASAGQTHE
ncbi:MAG: hypothetical protein ACM3L6_00295 [Deltaproteobacteria bacterium]